MNDSFFVFAINKNSNASQPISELIKVEIPYSGHNSHELAKEWIDKSGEKNTDYVVLQVFRNS